MKTLMWRDARLCTPALALACGAAFAQTDAPPLQPVVVTATRSEVPLREVLADVTMIERGDIERASGGAVADLLRRVPGVQMARSGGPAGTTSVYLRGGDTRFTAVLIDGVRVDTQATGGVNWQAIPLSQIERIEVVRGPASAVYGSDAISGVIQIFTRKGQPGTQFDVGVGGGDHGTVKSDASVSGKVGRVDYALSGLSERSRGFDSTTNNNPDRDGYRSNGGSGRLGWNLTDAQRVEVSALRSHVDGQYDAYASTADDHALHDLESVHALWSARWMPSWKSTVSFGQAKDHYETRPSIYTTDTRVRTATWQNDVRLGSHTVHATLERREDKLINSDVASALNERTQDALALGWNWRQSGVAFQVNGRHDRNDVFGSVNTGSVGAGVDLAEGWRVQSTVSNGFRAPTVYQQFSAEYGNRNLKPERSRSNIELALHHRAGAFESSATVYRNRVTDLIVFQPTEGPPPCRSEYGCYDNAGNAVLKGITLTSAYAADGLRIAGSIDFLSAKNRDTGKDLPRRAPRLATFSIDKELGDTTVGVQWLVSDKRYDNPSNTTVLGGYSVVNLDLQHRLNAEWRFLMRADNFFDKKYQMANTYVTNPMTVFVGVRWSPRI